MSLLRIYCSFADSPERCRWALVDGAREALARQGSLSEAPRRVERVQLVLPAAQVRLIRTVLPQGAGRAQGAMLAFAVEDEMLGEPDAQEVTKLGPADGGDILAVVDKAKLQPWLSALDALGIRDYELYSEILLLPWSGGQWSLAWDGREGFVRSGEFEGAATDCGDRDSPPLSLRLMLEAAANSGNLPESIAVYPTAPDAGPDFQAWQAALGIDLRPAGRWDWTTAAAEIPLARSRRPWRLPVGLLRRLRPAAAIVLLALAIHGVALVVDWARLAHEQQHLRQQMVAQFRAAFPEAVAVVAPLLQMRRKLADARHDAGVVDAGDFLPMLAKVGAAAKGLPAHGLHVLSYESGRMSLQISAATAAIERLVVQLRGAGLTVDRSAPDRNGRVVITVRTS